MKKIKSTWKWYEYLMLGIGWIIIIIGFIFGSDKNYFSFFASIYGIFTVLTTAKGLFYAPIVGIGYCVLYVLVSITQQFWGEVLIYSLINFPLCVIKIISWLRNRNKQNRTFININKVKWQEYLILFVSIIPITFGFYFLLKALNTNELLVSTFSIVTSLIAEYLLIRRNKFYAIGYMANDIVCIILWSLAIASNGIALLPTLLYFCFTFVNDLYGFINWLIMEKKQKKQINEMSEEITQN